LRMENHSSLRRREYCTADILEDEVRMTLYIYITSGLCSGHVCYIFVAVVG